MISLRALKTFFFLAFCLSAQSAWPGEWNPAARTPATTAAQTPARLIVQFRPSTPGTATLADGRQAIRRLAARSGVNVKHLHQPSTNLFAVQIDPSLGPRERAAAVDRLRADPAVLAVEPDRVVRRHALSPNDPLFSDTAHSTVQPIGQWYLKANGGEVKSAIDAVGAWRRTQGDSSVVVAVLDTGVRFDHPDLAPVSAGGRLLPGYDFVSADADGRFLGANDLDDRDPDPTDPGDWVDAAYLAANPSNSCEEDGSSWHGTRTAGIIGAMTNNGAGVAGIDWKARLLPVRVIGRCGGHTSDLLAALRWAAGLSVPGVPDNPNPAKVINLSLGSPGPCSFSQQIVVDEVTARGSLIVASAGNDKDAVASPANCRGVLAVAGLRHAGTKVGYSNFGSEVGISAPAGNCVSSAAGAPCLYSIDTTTNQGSTAPGPNGYTDQYFPNVGTSFAAPMVSGVLALMLSIDPSLSPSEMISRIRAAATPFPIDPSLPMCPVLRPVGTQTEGQCNCTTTQCGAGMLNAAAAVEQLEARPDAPTGLSATVLGAYAVDVRWQAAPAGSGIVSYRVYRDALEVATVATGTTYSDTELQPSTAYAYRVAACTGAGRCSAPSAPVSVKTKPTDADRVFNWAEAKYPELFSPPATTQSISGYSARAYRNGVYLGAAGGRVYVYGPPWDYQILDVGEIGAYLPQAIIEGY